MSFSRKTWGASSGYVESLRAGRITAIHPAGCSNCGHAIRIGHVIFKGAKGWRHDDCRPGRRGSPR